MHPADRTRAGRNELDFDLEFDLDFDLEFDNENS